MDTFEIKTDNVNVKEIMELVRKQTQKKRESGVYEEKLSEMLEDKLSNKRENLFEQCMNTARGASRFETDEPFTSHRPVLGYLIIPLKRLVRFMVKVSLQPLFFRQEIFNSSTVKSLEILSERIDDLKTELSQTENKK